MNRRTIKQWLSAILTLVAITGSSGLYAASKWCYGPTLDKAKCGKSCVCWQEDGGSYTCNCETKKITTRPVPQADKGGKRKTGKSKQQKPDSRGPSLADEIISTGK